MRETLGGEDSSHGIWLHIIEEALNVELQDRDASVEVAGFRNFVEEGGKSVDGALLRLSSVLSWGQGVRGGKELNPYGGTGTGQTARGAEVWMTVVIVGKEPNKGLRNRYVQVGARLA